MLEGIPDWALTLAILFAPLTIVIVIGMLTGYDISLLFKPKGKRPPDDKE